VGVVVCLVAAAACLPFQSHHPDADEQFYFGVLRSLHYDWDVDLRNEADRLVFIEHFALLPRLSDGRIANPFAFGSTLLWWPFYAAADATVRVLGLDADEGYARAHRGAVGFATSFWVCAGLLLLAASARRLGASPRFALGLAAIVLGTTPLIGYITHAPAMAHGNGFFMASLVLWLCLTLAERSRDEPAAWAACGLAVGFAFCVRWQDALFVILPTAVLWSHRRQPVALLTTRAAALVSGLGLGALPQLIYWRALYGRSLHTPLGGDFLALAHADPLAFLFSTWNGVFSSHPILLLAFVGLLVPGSARLPWLRAHWLWPAALGLVVSEALICMSAMDWWAGGSFGQRRMISVLPLLALGLWAAIEWLWQRWPRESQRWGIVALVGLLLWNLLSLTQLRRGVLPYNPVDPVAYANEEPWRLYDHARRIRLIALGRDADAEPSQAGERLRSSQP
jgi:hypothetical protein